MSRFIPHVDALIQDPTAPTTLYAGTADGVFKSIDSGDNWRLASAGLSNLEILSLAIDPQVPNVLYAGGLSGFYRSSDGAATWSAVEGLRDLGVSGIAINPQDPARIFACGPGIRRSTDRGQTWSRVGPDLVSCSRIVIDPRNPETLYALATHIGSTGPWVFKSIDGGTTWVQRTDGLPFGPRGPQVGHAIAIDPISPSTLYVASSIGLYKTTSAAGIWFGINQGLPCDPLQALICASPSAIAVDPIDPMRVYVGVGMVFCGFFGQGGADRGFFRSTTGGASWVASNTGLQGRLVLSLLVDASRPERVLAGTDRGIFRSEDAGVTWREASRGLERLERLRLLLGRFFVELRANDPRTGRTAVGQATAVNDLFGYFTLPELTGNADNPEVFVKMLDGRPVNGHFWVFHSGLTDLEYTVTVTDTFSLSVRTYSKDFGSPCGAFDTSAF